MTLVSKQAFIFQLFTIVRNTKQAQESVEFGESQQVRYQLIISCHFVFSFLYFSCKTLQISQLHSAITSVWKINSNFFQLIFHDHIF